jgi:hypothetical protein
MLPRSLVDLVRRYAGRVMKNQLATTDLWVKVVDMLQQNWAAIESAESKGVRVFFIPTPSSMRR